MNSAFERISYLIIFSYLLSFINIHLVFTTIFVFWLWMAELYHLQSASSLFAADVTEITKAWSIGGLLSSPDSFCVPFAKAGSFLQ